MNHQQKIYVLDRTKEVQDIKLKESKEKYEIKEIRLPEEKRFELIYKNKVSLLKREKVSRYTDLIDAYDFSSYEIPHGFKKEYEPLIKKIKQIAQNARDQIMLGDCQEALKLIKELESLSI